jgi:hypothetical protein
MGYVDVGTYDSHTLYNSGWIPKKISFEGNLTNTQTETQLSGNVNIDIFNAKTFNFSPEYYWELEERAKRDLNVSIEINGKLTMKDRPDALVNATYETGDTNATHHKITASYTYGSTQLSLSGYVSLNGEDSVLTFTNSAGYSATSLVKNREFIQGDKDAKSGSLVKKDGEIVGVVKLRKVDGRDIPVIEFNDGSFQSLI